MPSGVPVCIFVKPFTAGEVKTRLIPSLGAAGAAQLAEAMFQDTRSVVQKVPWAQEIIASTGPLRTVPPDDSNWVWPQGEGTLGDRLERILRRALAKAAMAIAIGADSPGLPLRVFEEARRRLQSDDAVLGPCEDGGFYLLGLKRCPPGLLDGIGWSQPDTLPQIHEKLQRAGFKISLLEPWFDVDRPEDLERLYSRIAAGQISAPRSAEVLGHRKRSLGHGAREA